MDSTVVKKKLPRKPKKRGPEPEALVIREAPETALKRLLEKPKPMPKK